MAILNTVYTSNLQFINRIDAELYNPSLVRSFKLLKNLETKSLSNVCIIRSGTTPVDRDDSRQEGPILFKTTDIRNNILNPYEKYYHISQEINERMKQTKIKANDILLNIVGATLDVIGRSAFTLSNFEGSNITQAMTLLRIKDQELPNFTPEFIFAYFNTRFAQDQIKRYARPTGQYNLNLNEVGAIIIPKINYEYQVQIRELILESARLRLESSARYSQAQSLLEKELGMDKIKFSKPTCYISNYDLVVKESRISSYYFQPKYLELLNVIKPLSNSLRNLTKTYSTGFPFASSNFSSVPTSNLLIKINNLLEGEVDLNNPTFLTDRETKKAPNERTKQGDILIGMSGTIGISSMVQENTEGAYINQRILRITPKDISSNYLCLVLNSLVGKMQFERIGTGGVQTNISPKEILNIYIPRLSKEVEEEISSLVENSYNKNNVSKRILASAIKKVEDFIEKESSKN